MPVAKRRAGGALPARERTNDRVRVQKQIKRPRAAVTSNLSGRNHASTRARRVVAELSVAEPREVIARRKRGAFFEYKISWVGKRPAQATWCVRGRLPELWCVPFVSVLSSSVPSS
jgi:hypothetical protein